MSVFLCIDAIFFAKYASGRALSFQTAATAQLPNDFRRFDGAKDPTPTSAIFIHPKSASRPTFLMGSQVRIHLCR